MDSKASKAMIHIKKSLYLLLPKLMPILGICILCLLILLPLDYLSSHNTNDLISRIVGTRVYLLHKDPYTFHKDDTTPIALIDPNDFKSEVNRVTVTPLALFLHIPLVDFSPVAQKMIWYCIEWVLFLTTFVLLFFRANRGKKIILTFLFILFATTPIWHAHILWGQIYILYAFLLALSYTIVTSFSFKLRELAGGFLIGFLSCLRPPFGIIWFSMIFFQRRNFFLGGVLGVLLGFILPTFVKGDIWFHYFHSMVFYSGTQLLEDFTSDKSSFSTLLKGSSSLQRILKVVIGVDASAGFFLVIILAVFCVFLFFLYKRKVNSFSYLFIYATYIACVIDVLLPSPRLIYSDITFLIPVSLIILNSDISRFIKSKRNVLLLFWFYGLYNLHILSTYLLLFYIGIEVFVMNQVPDGDREAG